MLGAIDTSAGDSTKSINGGRKDGSKIRLGYLPYTTLENLDLHYKTTRPIAH